MILKSPVNSDNYAENLIFTKNARTAWGLVIKSLKIDAGIVLLPCYIGRNDKEGSGVFDPVDNYDLKYKFYNLKDDLSVDIESFERCIESGDIRVSLVIHYFGFCRSDMQKIRDICDKHAVILVEDCAHYFGLKSNNSIGNIGDYSFYSIHKFLASETGGILKINNAAVTLDELINEEHISRAALEVYAKADVQEIYLKRIANYQLYESLFPPSPFYDVLYSVGAADIPQTFALKVKGGLREKLYFHLLEKNMPVVALYYRMIDEISPFDYPISVMISSEILNLPVHQDTNSEDIVSLVEEIKRFFKND